MPEVWNVESLKEYTDARLTSEKELGNAFSANVAQRIMDDKERYLLDRVTFREFEKKTDLALERTVGKEAFENYCDHASTDLDRLRLEIKTATDLAASVREGAATTLSLALAEQNKSINTRFESLTALMTTAQKPNISTWIMGLAVVLTILGGAYWVIINPINTQMVSFNQTVVTALTGQAQVQKDITQLLQQFLDRKR